MKQGRDGESGTGVGASLQFRSVVQQSSDMVSIYDEDGRYAFANPAHREVLGYEPEELIGHLPLDFLHPDEAESIAIEFAAQLAGERPPAPVEMRFRCRDGSYRVLEAVAVDLSSEPAVGGVFVVARDASDRKRAEAVVADQAAILERIARGADSSTPWSRSATWSSGGSRAGSPPCSSARASRRSCASSPRRSRRRRSSTRSTARPFRSRCSGSCRRASSSRRPAPVTPSPPTTRRSRRPGSGCWWAAPMFASDGVAMLGGVGLLLPDMREPHPVEEQILVAAGSLAAIAVERDTAPGAPAAPGVT